MAAPRADVAVKVSTEAAKDFVETYYTALQSARASIASFYMTQATVPDGSSLPIIVFNGNSVPDAVAMQKMFEEQMPPAKYQVQCYDCQVINPHYVMNNTQSGDSTSGKKMSILVSVSGYVKFGEPRGAKLNGFSETFVLVPNPAVVGGNKGKNRKEWLIQSQTFRLVV